MKPFKLFAAIIILSGNASLFSLHASSSWTYMGLKGETINTIFPMMGYSPNGIMVGTQTGIWNYEYTQWTKTWNGLPVYDIIKLPGDQFLAVAGNGSDSDGVYIGKVAAIGEPGTRWGFSLLVKCFQPTALAFAPMEGSCLGRIYVGNADGVLTCLLCKDTVKDVTAISCSPYSLPTTSMIIGSDDGMLYAGGRADITPQPGPGPAKYSWLLRGDASGLSGVKRMNATSIVEMPVQRGPDDGPVRYIAVATIDSGIQTFAGSTICGRYPSPIQSEPVISIVPYKTVSALNWTQIVVATPSGVYSQCPPNANCIWTQMPGLPGSPKCLAQYQGTMLWAGTDSGVYRYGNLTGIERKNFTTASSGMTVKSIRTAKGNIVFEINNNCNRHGKVSFFDTRGRCVKTRIIAQKQKIISNISKGLYLYRIDIDNKATKADKMVSF